MSIKAFECGAQLRVSGFDTQTLKSVWCIFSVGTWLLTYDQLRYVRCPPLNDHSEIARLARYLYIVYICARLLGSSRGTSSLSRKRVKPTSYNLVALLLAQSPLITQTPWTTEMSVVKCLACMLAIHLTVLLPNTLYPYVHSVHNNRSLEPKFRVGSGAGVSTRPAIFLGKNSRLVIPRRDLPLNRTWPIPWYTSTAAIVDTAVPRPANSGYRPGFSRPIFADWNVSADYSQLTHPNLFDSRQVLEVPKVVVETKIHHETTTVSYTHLRAHETREDLV